MLYHFFSTRQPTPGTGDQAFSMAFSLPAEDLLGYSQYSYQSRFNPFQPPQLMYQLGLSTAGLGGVQAGQIYTQGLMSGTPAQNVGGGAAVNVSSGSGFINPLTGIGG
jgi:hypothetical protein